MPNYVLAALMYSLLARFILSLFMDPATKNYIYRFFVRITDPLLWVLRFVTPKVVPPLLLVLFSVVWVLMIRFTFFVTMANAGLAPGVGS